MCLLQNIIMHNYNIIILSGVYFTAIDHRRAIVLMTDILTNDITHALWGGPVQFGGGYDFFQATHFFLRNCATTPFFEHNSETIFFVFRVYKMQIFCMKWATISIPVNSVTINLQVITRPKRSVYYIPGYTMYSERKHLCKKQHGHWAHL